MKAKFFTLAIILIAATISMSFVLPINHDSPDVEIALEKVTYGELKALYGEDIIDFQGMDMLGDTDVLLVNAMPCGQGIINIPCVGQMAYIQAQAQKDANACCCEAGYAALCCDPVLGVTAIYAIAQPNSPACNN